jgi:hypothetical protein
MKNKETLEEDAASYGNIKHPIPYGYVGPANDFINGVKWQMERSYSEEDLREAFRQGQDNMDYSDIYGLDSKLTEQEWFKQFKKNNEDNIKNYCISYYISY